MCAVVGDSRDSIICGHGHSKLCWLYVSRPCGPGPASFGKMSWWGVDGGVPSEARGRGDDDSCTLAPSLRPPASASAAALRSVLCSVWPACLESRWRWGSFQAALLFLAVSHRSDALPPPLRAGRAMVQRCTYRRRKSFRTASNAVRKVRSSCRMPPMCDHGRAVCSLCSAAAAGEDPGWRACAALHGQKGQRPDLRRLQGQALGGALQPPRTMPLLQSCAVA
jgi:hypothetical protein